MPQRWMGRLSSAVSVFLLLSMLVMPIVAASEDVEPTLTFAAAAYVCPYDPGMVSVANNSVPLDCTPVQGMVMHVSIDDTSVQTCSTGQDGLCFVQVPVDSWIVVTEDTSARPDLVPVSNPLNRHSTAMDAVFIHVVTPVVDDSQEPAPVPDPTEDSEPVITDPNEGGDPVIPDPNEGSDPDSGNGEGTAFEPVAGYVTGAGETGLVCYTAADVTSAPLHTFADGDAITMLSEPANGFVQVNCGETVGYVDAAYVGTQPPAEIPVEPDVSTPVASPSPEETAIPATPEAVSGTPQAKPDTNPQVVAQQVADPANRGSVEMVVNAPDGELACYSAVDVEPFPVIMTFVNGNQFFVNGPDVTSEWLPVECAGQNGFVKRAHTTAADPAPPTPSTSVEMLVGVGSTGLACRTAPHPAATVIITLPMNTQFYATGPVVNGWLPVQCKGRNGYIPAGLTTAGQLAPKPATSVEMLIGVGSTGLACRTSPHPQGTYITTLPGGTQFYATGPVVNGWLPVLCKGQNGFIPGYLTTAVAKEPKAVTSVEMLTTTLGLACRTAPHPQASFITTLPGGTQFYATGPVVNGWLPVICKGRDGFIPAHVTTAFSRPATKAKTSIQMMVNTGSSGQACRTAPHPQASVIKVLSNTDMIVVTGAATSGWLPVQCEGRDGYVQVAYTTLTWQPLKSGISATTIISTGRSGVVCRSAPSIEASAITTLWEGGRVTVTGAAVHSWLPVQCGEKNGFVYLPHTTTRLPHDAGGTRPAVVQGTGSSGLACRTAPGGGTQIMVLAERTPVDVISWANGWALVKCGQVNGYVSMRYLTFNASDPWTTSESIWIDVNLSSQYAIFYQGERIIGQTYVSTGRWPEYETPTGTFYINSKIQISAMAGCSGGECWYVPDVPWQMYFTYVGHAFHGAYWHNDFGTRRSHGCVNLPVGIANWLYNITPIGTRVNIHY